jgi:peptidyl-prolyl cis-trans isomerase D
MQPIAEVKGDIVPVLEQQKSGAAMQNLATQLTAEAKKDGIDKTAAAHNLKAVTTDYLTKDGTIPGVADGSQLLAGAFSGAKGAAPASVSTGDGFAVYQVADVKPAHAPSFDEYKQHLLDDYREQQLPQLLNAQLGKLDDRAKVLNDLKKAAAEMKIPVKTSDMVGRDGQVPDVGALTGQAAVAFTLNKGTISGPINLGRTGIVLSVIDKQEPTAQEIADNFAQTREQLLDAQRGEVFQVYMSDLMQKYENGKAVRYSQKQPAAPVGN